MQGELPRVLEVKDLSDKDADYIAAYVAEAMAGSDCFNFMITGVAYDEDPEVHRLLMRACLDRSSTTGSIVVTEDRCRVLFRPGEQKRFLDWDYQSPKDDAWNSVIARCGGKEAMKARMQAYLRAVQREWVGLCGESAGSDYFRTGNFAVHPDFQGKGLGYAINMYVHEQAIAAGKSFAFGTMGCNVPKYERMGARKVAGPVHVPLDRLDLYPGNDTWYIMQMFDSNENPDANPRVP